MLKRKNTSDAFLPKGMTPILPLSFRNTTMGTGLPISSVIHPVTDTLMAHQVQWLMSVAGVPGPPVKEEGMKKFHIEALYPGGQYDGTTKDASCLSEAIHIMLSNRVGAPVARGFVAEVQKGEVRTFQLLNAVRVY